MIRRFLAGHRSRVLSVAGGTVVTALVVTLAVTSSGYTAQKVDLSDAAVWVTSHGRQLVGRANTQLNELNTVVEVGSDTATVVQDGATVLVVDAGAGTLSILDPATATLADSVALPPETPQVRLAGERAAIFADGDLWTTSTIDLAAFDSSAEPALALGAGTLFSLAATGSMVAFTPATQTLSRIDPEQADGVTETIEVAAGAATDSYQLSQVNGHWAVLNVTTGILHLAAGAVDLSDTLAADAQPRLQEAAATGDRLLIAHRGGLTAVPVGGGAATELLAGQPIDGAPATPTTAGRCSYAAWADGTAWQACGIGSPVGSTATLAGLAGDASLEYRQNGTRLLLNDSRNGTTWNVQDDNRVIDNWADLIDPVSDDQQVAEVADDTPPEYEETQAPPVAVDDDFGARPGRTLTLPVLLNDYDPNNDVLVIDGLGQPPAGQGRVDLVADNQQVQLTLSPEAVGTFSFDYSISDGRGGSATAGVTVTVRTPEENSAPEQLRQTRLSVAAGGIADSQVLGDWVDPDGDPFYLTAATAIAPDAATGAPAGTVVFTDSGTGNPNKQVGLAVSDGSLTGAGTLDIDVYPVGAVPIVADAFAVRATAGSVVTVAPLEHARGGSGTLRLGAVPDKPGVTITADFTGGTFSFRSDTVGVHYLDYAVTDGTASVTGIIRVDVAPAPDSPGRPITVPHTLFLRAQQATIIDVLATDFDPAGGVLLVTGSDNVPDGMTVEILDQHLVRVTLTRPLESGSSSFGYTVSNGLAEAAGTVTVIEIPATIIRQPPVAAPDTVSVRVGDTVDIPVLANDVHPDAEPLSLDPTLSTALPAGAGLLFASGRVLRYLAPDQPGNFTAVYRVNAPDGQFANAEVHIAVREADPASNNPPLPTTVTARVLAGDTVRIPIPRTGIDPDGDSVQLLGQETNPEKGTVTAVDADSLSYRAGDYSAGTDTFSYAVIDALGARGIGTVRVGISARPDGARNPVAVPDEVTVRPGSRVSVRVLGNDSDPDGGALTVTAVTDTDGGTADSAVIDDDLIVVTAPAAAGRYGYVYEIQNERGGTSSAFLTVVVSPDAPRAYPEAADTRLSLSDVLGRRTVDVDVLAGVFFAEGPASDLVVAVLPGYAPAGRSTVTADGRIRITVGAKSQIIPFSVTHPQDSKIVSYAFIWVPGTDDALPQLRAGATPLVVASEATLSIDINDYVVAVADRTVQLTDRNTVRATHANGADLSIGARTLEFTSADHYFGPASISFEVTDGASPTDPAGRTATIVLPITVTPRQNQPPAFDGALIDFEPDQTKVIDLAKLTSYPYPEDRDELAFTVLDPQPTGFEYSLAGSLLTVHALAGTQRGSTSAVTIGVRDDLSAGKAGRIVLNAVASTRPLPVPATDAAIAPRGRTTVIDVLANDGATNPFATPLRVLAVRGLDQAGLPAGVSITPSADNSRLSVRVAADALPTDTTLQYQVADATNDPARYTWGTVRISVQDVPDAATGLRITGFGDGRVTVAFNPGAANNSPVTGYLLGLVDADSGRSVGSSSCASTTCTLTTPGNGQANAVRVSVAAQNAVGTAVPATLPGAVWSDVIPAAPTGLAAVPVDGGLLLGWNVVAPTGGGTAIRGYQVSVDGGAAREVSATGPLCDAGRCTLRVDGLANGSSVSYSVSARNDAYPALSTWNSTSGTGLPYGPAEAGAVTATATDASGAVTVTWAGFADHGDAIGGYYVQRLSGSTVPTGAGACTVSGPAPGTLHAPGVGGSVVEQKSVPAGDRSVVFDGLLADNGSYSFVVWGHNRAGCAASAVVTALVRPAPGEITDVTGAMETRGDGWDYRLSSIRASAGIDSYNLRAAGSAAVVPFAGTGWPRELLDLPFGAPVAFQLQACTAWGSCGPWSATFTAPEPSVDFSVTGLAYDGVAGRFSWTAAPDNGDLAVGFACRLGGSPAADSTPAGSGTSCTLPTPLPETGTVLLTVTVNGHSHDYSRPIPTKAITP